MEPESREEVVGEKRKEEEEEGGSEEDLIGPMPAETRGKKRRRVEYEHIYVENLPSSEVYERSYMHREVVTHLLVTKTGFLITASCDGHLKFWKKQGLGIEFVKHFRTHLGNVQDISANSNGLCPP